MKDSAKPPETLSPAAAGWWERLRKEYALDDEAALLLLETALVAFDRMTAARELIEAEGLTFRDRWGQVKGHPATTIERDSRAGMLAALKALNLDIEPLRDAPGRPGGGKGV